MVKIFEEKEFTIHTQNPDPDNRVYTYCEVVHYFFSKVKKLISLLIFNAE